MSDDDAYGFTLDSTRRIAAVVRDTESTPVDGTGRQTERRVNRKQVVIVKITGDAAGGEKYNAKMLGPNTNTVSASGNLSEADLGVASDENDVLFLNIERVGSDTHILTEDSQQPYAIGIVSGFTDDNPPLQVVKGLSLSSVDCDDEEPA